MYKLEKQCGNCYWWNVKQLCCTHFILTNEKDEDGDCCLWEPNVLELLRYQMYLNKISRKEKGC